MLLQTTTTCNESGNWTLTGVTCKGDLVYINFTLRNRRGGARGRNPHPLNSGLLSFMTAVRRAMGTFLLSALLPKKTKQTFSSPPCILHIIRSCGSTHPLQSFESSPLHLTCTVKMKVFTAYHVVLMHTLCVLGQFRHFLSFLQ